MRRSLTTAVAAALWLLASCDASAPDETTYSPQHPAPSVASAAFARRFTDITATSGVKFRHVSGARGEKLLPETVGSGAALLDWDGDGHLDLFLVNSGHWPGAVHPGESAPRCALFRGRGDGTFDDVTTRANAGLSLYGMGCAVADYDADGDDDVYVTALGDNVLLRNDAGVFRDVADFAGVRGGRWRDAEGQDADGAGEAVEHPEWSTAAAWADFDRDGDLDLFVCNYVEWTESREIFTTLDGHTKAFTTPDRYRGLPSRLFLNRGDGTFEDASERYGLLEHRGKALGIAVWDFDRNGYLDVVVANDTRPNFLFLGGEGRLTESSLTLGIAYDEAGRARAGMGIDVAIHADDGVPAVAIGNFTDEAMSLYRWEDGGFRPRARDANLAAGTRDRLTFAVRFLDVDLDGLEDLVVINGHIEPEIARFSSGRERHAQSAQLFRGVEGGRFVDVSAGSGPAFSAPRVGRGLASGDIDGDGDIDFAITTNGGEPVLLRNDPAPDAATPHWLRVRLRDRGGNPQALGARVELDAGGRTRTRCVRTGSSYLSSSEKTLTFGLGAATQVDELRVEWPNGERTRHDVATIDRTIEIVRPRKPPPAEK